MSAIRKAVSKVVRLDAWANLFSSVGTRRDPRTRTRVATRDQLTMNELEAIYRGDGIGARIVDIPANEMTRKWITLEGDDADEVLARVEELKVKVHINRALRWANLYGGALVVLGIGDGQDLEMPLNLANIRNVEFLQVYDRHCVTVMMSDLQGDPTKADFGKPLYYTIQPREAVAAPFRIHASRVLVFDGEDMPDGVRQLNQGWGDSKLQRVAQSLSDLSTSMGGSVNLITDFVQAVLKMKGLGDLLMQGNDKLVRERLEILGLSRSILNVMLIDADEEDYSKQANSIAGVPDLLDRLMLMVSASTGIPATRLYGRAPAGQNATGESDLRNFYDEMAGEQDTVLRAPLEYLIKLIYLSREGPTRGKEPEVWKMIFNPLYEPTDKERAESIRTWAEGIVKLVDYGLMDDEAVTQHFESLGLTLRTSNEMLERRRDPFGSGDEPPRDQE